MVKPSEYYFGGFLFPWFWAQDLHQNFTGLVVILQYTFIPVDPRVKICGVLDEKKDLCIKI
jgi:hypothetical protein